MPVDRDLNPAPQPLDISRNRGATKYSRSELIYRMFWMLIQPLFRWSPRPCFAWRRFLLRLLGGRIGQRVNIYPSSTIYFPWMLQIGDDSSIGEDALIYNLGDLKIGSRATISHRAHLCGGSHDYTDPSLPLQRLPIIVGDDVWICADSFIGPNVTIGTGAVVGARSAVFKNIEPWTVVGGSPAIFIKPRVMKTDAKRHEPRNP